ncbi:tetratricopeptide repeat protein [Ferruginibacter profundus]
MKPFLLLTFFVALFCVHGTAQTKEAHYKKASELYDKADYSNCLKEVNAALRQDSTNSEYLFLKGNTLDRLEKYEEAFLTYSLLIKLYPKDAMALSQRGILLTSIQKPEYAIQDFTEALGFEKTDSVRLTLFINRGAAKINTRDFQGAYDDFFAAYQIDSLNIGVLNNLATVCDEVGKGDKTLYYLYRMIAIDSTFIGAYVNIGFKMQEMGDHKKAISFFDKALALDPKEPLSYSNRAFNKYKLGDLQGALNDINISIKLYPANSYAFRNRALILIAQKKQGDACKDIKEALRLGFTKMYGDEVEQMEVKYCKTISM